MLLLQLLPRTRARGNCTEKFIASRHARGLFFSLSFSLSTYIYRLGFSLFAIGLYILTCYYFIRALAHRLEFLRRAKPLEMPRPLLLLLLLCADYSPNPTAAFLFSRLLNELISCNDMRVLLGHYCYGVVQLQG